ncbi:MAG: chromosome segregation SMC family protein [Nitrososphaerota archaeon]|nr:chromosome segregation protein SMC [Candidatus Calditenuaceae archaeon]MDW8072933.1 chromosome segregation SMC family protein [Nitrososphaerota archaeon]
MVYIKRISIQGFKSFGAKRVIIKPEKGFMVITGPNGGGKSNVLDAIKFCLGELSNNALRVGKLSDLIHENNGRRLNQATVTLLLDNSDRALPLETDEVTISRTISSGGESIYRVNGRTVSRNELLSLLAAANIKPGGFNIITQGAVLSIAEKSPEELRRIIDDVAGVSEFDRRKSEVLRELEVADKNVAIVRAGLEEMGNRVKQLEVERNALTRSLLLSRYLSQLKRQKLLEELGELEQKFTMLENEGRILEERRTHVSSLVESLLRQRQEKLSKSREVESELTEIQARLNNLSVPPSGQVAPLDSLRYSIRSEGSRYAKIKRDFFEVLRRAASLKSEISTLENDLKKMEEQYTQSLGELSGTERWLEELKSRRSGLLSSLKKWREAVAAFEAKRAAFERELSRLEARVTLTDQRNAEVSQKLTEAEETLEKALSEKQRVENEFRRTRHRLEELESIIEKSNTEIQGLRSRIKSYEEMRAEIKALAEELARLKAEVEGSLKFEEVGERGSPRRKTPLTTPHIVRLRDFLTGDDLNSAKVSPLISDYLDTIVVERSSVAWAISSLATERGLNVSVLSLEGVERDGCAGDGCLACSLSAGNIRLRRVLHALFPNHVSGGQESFEPGQATVTPTGVHYNGHGFFRVLERARSNERPERLLRVIHETIAALEEAHGDCETALTNLRGKLNELENSLSDASFEKRELEAGVGRLLKRLEELAEDEKRLHERINDLKSELDRLVAERAALYENMRKVTKELEELDGPERLETDALQTQVEKLDLEINSLERRLGEQSTFVESIKSQLVQVSVKREELVGMISRMEGEVRRLKSEAELSKKRLKEIVDLYLESWRRGRERRSELEELSRRMSELLEARRELSEELSSLEDRIEEGRSELFSIESQTRNLAVMRVELIMRRNSILERLNSMSAPPVEDLSLLPREFLEIIGIELERELNSIGMVNQLAIQQYSELIIEYKGRSEKVELLEKERRRIIEVLEKLDAQKLEVFMKTFSRVSEGFGKYFAALTGGSGWLEFSNPENPLESGVEMYVAFPGRSAKPSRSISGGEKSVSAVALLMAFQGLTPADFLVMDEVDAHMDANYSKNLAALLKEFSAKTQVITVSLKDVIAERADQLIGVYNQDGESRVVVTRLEENQS